MDYLRGHQIELENDVWVYSDDKSSVLYNHKKRPCGKCNQFPTPEGHDACLGTLPGLMNACCGHGFRKETYVQFLDGHAIHGEDAILMIEILKRNVSK